MIDHTKLKAYASFIKKGSTIIVTNTGKEYKLSATEAVEVADTLVGTGLLIASKFLINPDNIVSFENDNGKTAIDKAVTGKNS